MTSRHDHFPRLDRGRRNRIMAAADTLEAEWKRTDILPQGLAAAIDATHLFPPGLVADHLQPWLDDIGWLQTRLAGALALLAADDFARPSLRPVGGGEGPVGLILAERGVVRLSLQIQRFEQGGTVPATAVFVPGVAAIRILSTGGAMLHRHRVVLDGMAEEGCFRASTAAPCRTAVPRPLVAGETLRLDTAREAFSLADATGDAMLLELVVQPPSALPIRCYDVASGRLVHVSTSRRDSSFRMMALALLRSFGRRDAVPLFTEATRDADFAARWSALRELVALDPAAARPRVEAMAASDPHPEIRRAGAATLALYPIAKDEPCPV